MPVSPQDSLDLWPISMSLHILLPLLAFQVGEEDGELRWSRRHAGSLPGASVGWPSQGGRGRCMGAQARGEALTGFPCLSEVVVGPPLQAW